MDVSVLGSGRPDDRAEWCLPLRWEGGLHGRDPPPDLTVQTTRNEYDCAPLAGVHDDPRHER